MYIYMSDHSAPTALNGQKAWKGQTKRDTRPIRRTARRLFKDIQRANVINRVLQVKRNEEAKEEEDGRLCPVNRC